MALTRADAIAFLNDNYAGLAGELGVSTSLVGWKPVVDRSLRELGVTEANLAAATVDDAIANQRDGWFATLDYYALLFLRNLSAPRVDVTASGDAGIALAKQRSQLVKTLKEMLDEAEARAQRFGYLTEGQAMTWGQFTLDYIESPDPLLPA